MIHCDFCGKQIEKPAAEMTQKEALMRDKGFPYEIRIKWKRNLCKCACSDCYRLDFQHQGCGDISLPTDHKYWSQREKMIRKQSPQVLRLLAMYHERGMKALEQDLETLKIIVELMS